MSRRAARDLTACACSGLATSARGESAREAQPVDLGRIANQPVLDVSFLKQPVTVASVELLRNGRVYLVRVRSADGVEAITVPNPARMALMYPLFLKQIAPFFVGKDARDLERLLWDVYRRDSNYKLRAWPLGVRGGHRNGAARVAGQAPSVRSRTSLAAPGRRDIPCLCGQQQPWKQAGGRGRALAEDGGRGRSARLKIRLGGRMSRNADSLPGRTEGLIPKVRAAFGDSFTLYADANSSYDAREGVRIGRLLEAHGYGFYEEPCEFDDLWSTKEVADALNVPVAGGNRNSACTAGNG